VNVIDFKHRLGFSLGDLCRAARNNVALAREYLEFNAFTVAVFNKAFDTNIAAHIGRYFQPIAAEIRKVKMSFVSYDDINVAVNTAVECEIGSLRINVAPRGIVDANCQNILVGNVFRYIKSERRISALVLSDTYPVKINLANGGHAAKLDEYFFILGNIDFPERLLIRARASEIVVSAVGAVCGVPCVREIYCFKSFRRFFFEMPVFIYIDDFSHFDSEKDFIEII
jgi:hypothetical protein